MKKIKHAELIRNKIQTDFVSAISEAEDGEVFICKKAKDNKYEFIPLKSVKYKNGTLEEMFQKIEKQIKELKELVYNNQQINQEAIELLADEVQSMKVL